MLFSCIQLIEIKLKRVQISSFRESRSDNKRFYIFTATKTLHLRTNSKKERVAWINALISSRSLFPLRPLNDDLSLVPADLSLSTERLKNRLLEEGISEILVKDCEQIMLKEFSEIHGQVKVLCEERSNLLDTLRQLEVTFCLIVSVMLLTVNGKNYIVIIFNNGSACAPHCRGYQVYMPLLLFEDALHFNCYFSVRFGCMNCLIYVLLHSKLTSIYYS